MSRDSSAVAKRVTRALDSFFHVEAESEPGEYRVHSESGSTYTVTLPDGTCACPDGQRGPWCKHAYRALFVTGHAPKIEGVPADTDADPDTRETADHIEPTRAEDAESGDMLTERVNRFETNNPGASALDAISRLH